MRALAEGSTGLFEFFERFRGPPPVLFEDAFPALLSAGGFQPPLKTPGVFDALLLPVDAWLGLPERKEPPPECARDNERSGSRLKNRSIQFNPENPVI